MSAACALRLPPPEADVEPAPRTWHASDLMRAHVQLIEACVENDAQSLAAHILPDATVTGAGGLSACTSAESIVALVGQLSSRYAVMDFRPRVLSAWFAADGPACVTSLELRLLVWSVARGEKLAVDLTLSLLWRHDDGRWRVSAAYPIRPISAAATGRFQRICSCSSEHSVHDIELRSSDERGQFRSRVRLLNPNHVGDDSTARRFAFLEIE